MKLLDTSGANTKLAKNNANKKGIYKYLSERTGHIVNDIRVAGLSLMPDERLCPFAEIAECRAPCLENAGRGRMPNVKTGREKKADFVREDRQSFLAILRRELYNFKTLCHKDGQLPVVRLNVLSDVPWEMKLYSEIPQEFEDIYFYDYTKIASRMRRLPPNYDMMFSWSGTKAYQPSVEKALSTDTPIAVVFDCEFPDIFLGRPVYDGDQSDILNLTRKNGVIALKAKGKARDLIHPFIVTQEYLNECDESFQQTTELLAV